MLNSIYKSIVATLVLGVILCGVYPLLVTGIGHLFFPEKVAGSLITKNGITVGSQLIGQNFSKAGYFHGRPSAAGNRGYDATSSSGSNLGPTNQKLYDSVKGNVERVLFENPSLKKGFVPTDLVTSSASGLDPHISPDGAEVQVNRVAQARKLDEEKVKQLVVAHTEGAQWGIFGEPVVNVLLLNLDLDRLAPLND